MEYNVVEEDRFPEILKKFEMAVLNFESMGDDLSSTYLKRYQDSPQSISCARYILENSRDQYVHFHCLVALREGLLREWFLLSSDIVEGIKSYLSSYLVNNVSLPYHVSNQCLITIASIVKRGWLKPSLDEMNDVDSMKISLFEDINSLMGSDDILMKTIGVRLCNTLVGEFSFSNKSTSMGMPIEFHRACMESFSSQGFLQKIMITILDTLSPLVNITNYETPHIKEKIDSFFQYSLDVISKALAWPYNKNIIDLSFSEEDEHVDIGEEWSDFINREDILNFFFHIFCTREHENTILSVCQIISYLSSVKSNVFNSSEQMLNFYRNFLLNIQNILNSPLPSFGQVQGFTQILQRFSYVISDELMSKVNIPLTDLSDFFDSLEGFTCKVLMAISQENYNLENLSDIITDILNSWCIIIPEEMSSLQSDFFKPKCISIFSTYLDCKLLMSRKMYHGIQLDNHEEQLIAIGKVSRCAAYESSQLLAKHIEERLQFISSSSGPDLSVLEGINWLLYISGHFLAYKPEGEKVAVPDDINFTSTSAYQLQENDPIVHLCTITHNLTEFYLLCAEQNRNLVPSSATTVCIWFWERWVNTYLFIDNGISMSPNLIFAYGKNNDNAFKVVDFLFRCVVVFLFGCRDRDLNKMLFSLFYTLSKKNIPYEALVQMNHWRALFDAYTSYDESLLNFPKKSQILLIKTLLNMRLHIQGNNYYHMVLNPLKSSLYNIFNNNFSSNLTDEVFLELVIRDLGRARGVVQSTVFEALDIIYNFFMEFSPSFIQVVDSARSVHSLVMQCLKLYHDFALFQLDWIYEEQKVSFFNQVGRLFEVFYSCKFTQNLCSKQGEFDEDQDKVRVMLSIVLLLSQQHHFRAIEVAFYGLTIAIPLITKDSLHYPELSNVYFNCTSTLFRSHSDKIPFLPKDIFIGLFRTLRLAFSHFTYDTMVLRRCLESLSDVIHFLLTHFQNTGEMMFGDGQLGIISDFTEDLIDLLFGDVFPFPLTDTIGTTLFCLRCLNTKNYTELFGTKIRKQNRRVHPPLSDALREFESKTASEYSPENRRLFCSQFKIFILSLRGYISSK
eukprot:TRINITY_DN8167_c0_g1_i1.p1 TRINITY_DN8167_c0_g1~~TRINITY_DN8167_c0_g1_i1.p1  ORF type:complete len:1073 (+),score=143.30 TRINITY_DN8167_c0_g1_i1:24-3242(+)